MYAFGFLLAVLIVNAVAGERGYLEVRRAERRYAEALADLQARRAENQVLREQIRRLRSDPAAVEEEIRRRLGYARAGELVFTIRDVVPPSSAVEAGGNSGSPTVGPDR